MVAVVARNKRQVVPGSSPHSRLQRLRRRLGRSLRDPWRQRCSSASPTGPRRVLVLAQDEARFLRHNFIGTEHLLLGLLREGDGVAAKALGELGVRLDDPRQRVKDTIGPAGTAPVGSPPFTPRTKRVLELSLREALQLGHDYISTEHILLGLVREGEGWRPRCWSAWARTWRGCDGKWSRSSTATHHLARGRTYPTASGSASMRSL